MLNCTQNAMLEGVQRQGSRDVKGMFHRRLNPHEQSYESRRKELGLETITKRRQGLFEKVIKKQEFSETWKDYMKVNPAAAAAAVRTRNSQKYIVPIARSSRHQNSPMVAGAKFLNESALLLWRLDLNADRSHHDTNPPEGQEPRW